MGKKWKAIESQGFKFHDYCYSDPKYLEWYVHCLELKGKLVKKLRVRSDTRGLKCYAVFVKDAR